MSGDGDVMGSVLKKCRYLTRFETGERCEMFFWFWFVVFEEFTIALRIERGSAIMHGAIAVIVYCIFVVGSAESVFSHRYVLNLALIIDGRI